jgi:hypothetical protein
MNSSENITHGDPRAEKDGGNGEANRQLHDRCDVARDTLHGHLLDAPDHAQGDHEQDRPQVQGSAYGRRLRVRSADLCSGDFGAFRYGHFGKYAWNVAALVYAMCQACARWRIRIRTGHFRDNH